MSIEYAIIVKNKTRLEALVERFNTKSQAKFYIERLGGNFQDYEMENEVFHDSLTTLQSQLSKVIKHKIIDRVYLPSYIFSDKNMIVVIGQDGLVANTAKYSQTRPIVAVNPDKQRYDGVLLSFDITNFIGGVESVLSDNYQSKKVNFAEARLNDGQRLLAFNDLFIGASSHISARYNISYDNSTEEQSSSGIIVSTKSGSTGWLSSVFNMAYGVNRLFEEDSKQKQKQIKLKSNSADLFEKDKKVRQPMVKDDQLLFVVREPFKSVRTQIDISGGVVNNQKQLRIASLMPTGGVIFSDGIESDFLQFNSGTIATIGIANETANLVTL